MQQEEETQQKLTLKKHGLQQSIKEGTAASLSGGFGSSYITPFALALNSNSFHIGMISSFSELASPLAQLWGSRLMEHHTRKKIVMTFVFLEALMWIPIMSLAYLFWKGIFPEYLPYALIGFYSLLAIFGGTAVPSWFSWMGDIIPEDKKGKYFSKRNRITGTAGVIAALVSAFLLDIFQTKGLALLGFAILFSLATTFRLISFLYFYNQYAPRFKLKKGYYFSMTDFLKRFDNFGKFAVYKAVLYFSLMIAGPFFAVYMLQDLQFSYTTFMIVSLSSSAFYLLSTPFAGKFSDKFGNKRLFHLANFLFVLTPLFWIFLKNPIALIFTTQLVAGIANAALVIGFTNFTYDAVSQQHRGICTAYTNILVGLGIFLGSLTGGFIIKYLHPSFMHPILFVFLISAGLRLLTGFFFLPSIKEEKRVKRLPPLRINLTHPFRTIHAEVGWFRSIFK